VINPLRDSISSEVFDSSSWESKMNRFVIHAVNLEPDGSGIREVAGFVTTPLRRNRFDDSKMAVILRINSGLGEYRTYKTVSGKDVEGPLVRIVHGKFLRIDSENIEADDLGPLPKY
jgi:hypothetical protein